MSAANDTTLNAVTALAERIQAAGIDPGQGVVAAQTATTLLRGVSSQPAGGRRLTLTLINLTETELLAELNQAAIDITVHEEVRRLAGRFGDQVAAEAAAMLGVESDRIVKALRPAFDAALAVVSAAKDAGLTPNTKPEDVINLGHDALDAFQTLPAAVATLDELVGIRNELTTLAGVGPRDHPPAAWLAKAQDRVDLQGAWNIAAGSTRYEQQTADIGFGSYMKKVLVKRTGGVWLDLLTAGYELRLNTAAEARAVVANAKRPAAHG